MEKGVKRIKPVRGFLALFILLLALICIMLAPFLNALLTAVVFAFIFRPVYHKLYTAFRNKTTAALIVTIVLVAIGATILFFTANLFVRELYSNIAGIDVDLIVNELQLTCTTVQGPACIINTLVPGDSDATLKTAVTAMLKAVTGKLYGFVLSLPARLFEVFIIIFITYYLLKEGDKLLNTAERLIPLDKRHVEAIRSRLTKTLNAVIFGNVIVALIQGGLAAVGFFLAGVPAPLLLGLLTVVTSMVPFLGAASVWAPTAATLLIPALIQADNVLLMKAIFLIIYGILFVSSIDNILKPKLIGEGAGIHPALMLLGILGGLSLFGFIGLVIGPVLVALFHTFIDIYESGSWQS